MTNLSTDELRVNVSIPVDLLARLFSTQQLCAADLTALDAESHASLRRLMLSVCAQQLRGHGLECEGCASQGYCQQMAATPSLDAVTRAWVNSISLH
jgi:hypothetical protein